KRFCQNTANDPAAHVWQSHGRALLIRDKQAFIGSAVELCNPDFDSCFDEPSCEIAGACRIQTPIHEPFACAAARDENLPDFESFQIVSPDWDGKNLARWTCHESANA